LIGRAHRQAGSAGEAARIATGVIAPFKAALAAAGAVHAAGRGMERFIYARDENNPQIDIGAGGGLEGSGEQPRSVVHQPRPHRGRSHGR
jgi:hypothetical protein